MLKTVLTWRIQVPANMVSTGENWRTTVTVFVRYASASRVTLSGWLADRQTGEHSFIKSTSTRKIDPPYTLLPCGVECTCVNVVNGGESGDRIKRALQKSDNPMRCPYFKSPDLQKTGKRNTCTLNFHLRVDIPPRPLQHRTIPIPPSSQIIIWPFLHVPMPARPLWTSAKGRP